MLFRALVAESVGTFLFVLVGVASIAADYLSGGASGLGGIALAHGLALAVLVSAAAPASGGHLNPAVTLGALVVGRLGAKDAALYVASQCAGAAAGAAAARLLLPTEAMTAIGLGTPGVNLGTGVTPFGAALAEALMTFALVLAVFVTMMDKRTPKVGGLYVGLALAAGILAIGPVSGAALNPARHFGPALLGGGFQNAWVYWAGPLLGGAAAAFAAALFFEERA